MSVKDVLPGTMALAKDNPKVSPVDVVQSVIGKVPKLECKGHYIGTSLTPSNAILHTSIMYGRWHNWDGKPLTEKPLFYNGLDEPTAQLLSDVSDDVVSIAKGIMKLRPKVRSLVN